MPNHRYQRGRSKETRIVNKRKAEGYWPVARSAGSHSPVDVWAINKEKKEILITQCKPHSMLLVDGTPNKEAQRLIDELKTLEGTYTLKTSVEFTRQWTGQSSTSS